MKAAARVSATGFFAEYHGHPLDDLEAIHRHLRKAGKRIVWLAGDSSLDNKHWLYPPGSVKTESRLDDPAFTKPACNGYEHCLAPARAVCDVAFWVNAACSAAPQLAEYACINASVEESSLGQREELPDGLLPHDAFVRDNMRDGDVLIVSAGGNDIALRPTRALMVSLALLWLTPQWLLRRDWGMGKGPMREVFLHSMQRFTTRLCARAKPRLLLPCMIYFPSVPGSGWSDTLLSYLSYSPEGNPGQLQEIIRSGFREFTSNIVAHDAAATTVVPVPLFELLDCTNVAHYENRVEPSVEGGRLMAEAFASIIASR